MLNKLYCNAYTNTNVAIRVTKELTNQLKRKTFTNNQELLIQFNKIHKKAEWQESPLLFQIRSKDMRNIDVTKSGRPQAF